MEEQQVRDRADALGAALVAGDVERATADFSQELRRNLGEVIALLPLPAIEASIESIDRGSSGFTVVHRFVGESEEVQIQTRWKDRDGNPTVIEASHLSSAAVAAQEADATEAEAPEAE